jgi:CRISPR-associated endonuclease Cas2
MYVAIAYDISNDANRSKLAKRLLEFGIRTQKSFFEFDGIGKREINVIKKLIERYAEPEDFVTIYEIEESKTKRVGDVEYLTIDDLIF